MRKLLLLLPFILLIACTSEPFEVVDATYPDGKKQIVKYYKTEKKQVLVAEFWFYENGQKKMGGIYKKGKRNGEWMAWYKDGTIWSKGYYKNGIENGLKTVWYENGQKYYEGMVRNEKRIGTWRFWDENGKLLKKVNYDKDM